MNRLDVWIVIVGLGIGTYLIRFSFLGLIGDRPLPPFVLRLLRYTPVAVLPALVAPQVFSTCFGQGAIDWLKISAALATLGIGWWTGKVVPAMILGMLIIGLGTNL